MDLDTGEDLDGAANLKARRKQMVKLRRIESDVDFADEAEVGALCTPYNT